MGRPEPGSIAEGGGRLERPAGGSTGRAGPQCLRVCWKQPGRADIALLRQSRGSQMSGHAVVARCRQAFLIGLCGYGRDRYAEDL